MTFNSYGYFLALSHFCICRIRVRCFRTQCSHVSTLSMLGTYTIRVHHTSIFCSPPPPFCHACHSCVFLSFLDVSAPCGPIVDRTERLCFRWLSPLEGLSFLGDCTGSPFSYSAFVCGRHVTHFFPFATRTQQKFFLCLKFKISKPMID